MHYEKAIEKYTIDQLLSERDMIVYNFEQNKIKFERSLDVLNKKINSLRNEGIKTAKEISDELAATPRQVQRKDPPPVDDDGSLD
jgi:hypothetical protein